jgi:hypothetical protein
LLPTKNLKLYLPFEGNANDASGNGNNGSVDGASLTAGKFGQCYSFDGSDDYIDINTPAIQDGTQDFTVAFWYNQSSGGRQQFINFADDSDFIIQTGENQDDNVAHVRANQDGSWTDIVIATAHNYNTWYFLTVTYHSTNGWNLYINATKEDDNAQTGVFGSKNWGSLIGAWSSDPIQHFFHGKIDSPMIFSKALSQQDIKRVMLNFHPLNG